MVILGKALLSRFVLVEISPPQDIFVVEPKRSAKGRPANSRCPVAGVHRYGGGSLPA